MIGARSNEWLAACTAVTMLYFSVCVETVKLLMPPHNQLEQEDFLVLLVLSDITRDQAAEEALGVFCQGACVAPTQIYTLSRDEAGISFSDSAAFQDTKQIGGSSGQPTRCILVLEMI